MQASRDLAVGRALSPLLPWLLGITVGTLAACAPSEASETGSVATATESGVTDAGSAAESGTGSEGGGESMGSEESTGDPCGDAPVPYCGAVGPECNVECIACTEHENCPQSACDIQEGECFHLDDVRVVDPERCGSEDNVFCEAGAALDSIPAAGAIRLEGRGDPESLTFGDDKRVAFVGVPGGDAELQEITVLSGAAYVSGVGLSIEDLTCRDASIWIDRVKDMPWLSADQCDATLRRTHYLTSFGHPTDSTMVFENSFLWGDNPFADTGSSYELRFSTVYATGNLFYEKGQSTLDVRVHASIVVAEGSNYRQFEGTASLSNFPLFTDPDANREVTLADVPFVDRQDLHLLSTESLLGIVEPGEGPALDIDGDPRDPMAPVPGADVPAP